MKWSETREPAQAAADVQALFAAEFGGEGLVWSAPGRVNLIGEHVDYAGGISVPFALSQRTYVAARSNDDGVYRVASRFGGEVMRETVREVGPGQPTGWVGYVVGTIWAYGVEGGFDIAIESDVPVGAGLSSSAALECSAGLAAAELAGDVDRTRLMEAAIRAENEVVGASTGGLDQRIALFAQPGHALAIDFAEDTAEQVPFDIAARGLAVLVMNTNAPHSLADGQYASRRAVIDGVTADLNVSSLRYAQDAEAQSARWAAAHPQGDVSEWTATVARRVRHVVSEIERTAGAIEQLKAGDMSGFGESMQASHDYEVTVPQLDVAVDVAMSQGALGARMTGGGFGGSAIALLPMERVEDTAAAVHAAFAKAGFNEPEFAVALPGAGARCEA